MSEQEARAQVADFLAKLSQLRAEIATVVVGQRELVDGVLTCMLAGSHALLEGVPGLGKTLLIKTLADSLGLEFSRIQFTPDLMPSDIIGTTVIEDVPGGKPAFEFRKGPVFANILLADEINRATPKTQSALLEAMQEHRVTVGRVTHVIEEPYFVLATQNPLEQEGTYPLPEAQLDRFFFKLHAPFPTREQLHDILERTTSTERARARQVLSRQEIQALQALVLQVPIARHVTDYAIRLLLATHPRDASATPDVRRFVASGASPRGAQALVLAAKIRALFEGRFAASIDDVQAVAKPALRHRVLLNFEGEAEGIETDAIIEQLLAKLPSAEA